MPQPAKPNTRNVLPLEAQEEPPETANTTILKVMTEQDSLQWQ